MDKEFVTIAEAAGFLSLSPATLQNWITRKRFTEADGLRRFGGSTRIHFPTLKARAMANEIVGGKSTAPTKPAAKAKRRADPVIAAALEKVGGRPARH